MNAQLNPSLDYSGLFDQVAVTPVNLGLRPAGTYDVDTDEECIEGNRRTAYLRVATILHVHSLGSKRFVTIDPAGLEAALERDSETVHLEH